MQTYIELCIIKKLAKFQAHMKISRSTTETQKRKQKET